MNDVDLLVGSWDTEECKCCRGIWLSRIHEVISCSTQSRKVLSNTITGHILSHILDESLTSCMPSKLASRATCGPFLLKSRHLAQCVATQLLNQNSRKNMSCDFIWEYFHGLCPARYYLMNSQKLYPPVRLTPSVSQEPTDKYMSSTSWCSHVYGKLHLLYIHVSHLDEFRWGIRWYILGNTFFATVDTNAKIVPVKKTQTSRGTQAAWVARQKQMKTHLQ